MRFYFGVAAKEDEFILKELGKLRDDIGVCTSAFTYKTRSEVRKVVSTLGDFPLILDNGAIQAFRQGVPRLEDSELRRITKETRAEFLVAPDVIGQPEQSLQSVLSFGKQNSDLEMLAPLQSTNFGLLFEDKIKEEIALMKDVGYQRFGYGKPYSAKMSRADSVDIFTHIVRPQVSYLHFLGFPFGSIREYQTLNQFDSVDAGTYFLITRFRLNPYKHPDKAATILNDLINLNVRIAEFPRRPKTVGI